MDNIQEITLDIKDNHTYQQLYVKQYDYGSSIIFHIVNDGSPFDIQGVTAIFSLKKPDGHFVENNAEVINGNIQIKITEQMTSAYGKAKYSVTLFKDEVAITTITGIMKIDEAVIHPEDIESSDEYNVITDILNKVVEANESANIAKEKALEATNSANNAKTSETNAKQSETNAKASEDNASNSATTATQKASEASTSASNASTSATKAKTSETNASTSASIATTKATEASNSAQESKSYAVGTDNTFRENDATDNSKYYYEQAKSVAQNAVVEIFSQDEPTQEVCSYWLQEY